jgi:hypothetical protein
MLAWTNNCLLATIIKAEGFLLVEGSPRHKYWY